jgi:hypothetical protein
MRWRRSATPTRLIGGGSRATATTSHPVTNSLCGSAGVRAAYAFGVVTGPVVCDRDPDPFWQDPAEGSGLDWRVGIKIQERPEHPILRNDRRADPGFADAAILRMPGGGNPFPVTAAEWQILQSHRAPGASDGRAPSTSRGAPKISSGFFATISPSRPCTRTSARPRRTAPALHGV